MFKFWYENSPTEYFYSDGRFARKGASGFYKDDVTGDVVGYYVNRYPTNDPDRLYRLEIVVDGLGTFDSFEALKQELNK